VDATYAKGFVVFESTAVVPFDFNGDRIGVVLVDGNPWFVGTDLARILEYRDAANALRSVRERNRCTHSVSTSGGQREKLCINEAGLYQLVMRSRSPHAEKFQDWVTDEVLPQIRRTGSYVQAPSNYAEALRAAADQYERAEAEKAAKLAAQQQAAALAPSAAAWDHLGSGGGDLSVADAAKILNRDPGISTGRDRLFALMSKHRWIFRDRRDHSWRPYQATVDSGRLVAKPQSHQHPETRDVVLDAPQVRVTPKGLADLHRILGGRQPLALESGDLERQALNHQPAVSDPMLELIGGS